MDTCARERYQATSLVPTGLLNHYSLGFMLHIAVPAAFGPLWSRLERDPELRDFMFALTGSHPDSPSSDPAAAAISGVSRTFIVPEISHGGSCLFISTLPTPSSCILAEIILLPLASWVVPLPCACSFQPVFVPVHWSGPGLPLSRIRTFIIRMLVYMYLFTMNLQMAPLHFLGCTFTSVANALLHPTSEG